jgi:general stress protein 26
MNQEIFEKIETYLHGHKKMTLATVSAEGQAMAHTVQYVSEGNTVFFFTRPGQRKAENIRNNPKVGFTVDQDYEDWSKIQGVQIQGEARILEETDEIDLRFELFADKFTHLATIGKSFLDHHIIIEVKPALGRFLDNTVAFGHFDETTY